MNTPNSQYSWEYCNVLQITRACERAQYAHIWLKCALEKSPGILIFFFKNPERCGRDPENNSFRVLTHFPNNRFNFEKIPLLPVLWRNRGRKKKGFFFLKSRTVHPQTEDWQFWCSYDRFQWKFYTPRSTKSSTSNCLVQIHMKPKYQFECVPRGDDKSEFLDLVNFGGVAFSVATVIHTFQLPALLLKSVHLRLYCYTLIYNIDC